MSHSDEEWKPVVGFEGRYEVSNHGRVKSLKGHKSGQLRAPVFDKDGYIRFYLYKGSGIPRSQHFVHRLVAAAFIGACPPEMQVNHINSNRSDNRAINLEYVTPKGNTHHAMGKGRLARGSSHGMSKLHEQDVISMIQLSRMGIHATEIASLYGIHHSSVSRMFRGETWRHTTIPGGSNGRSKAEDRRGPC